MRNPIARQCVMTQVLYETPEIQSQVAVNLAAADGSYRDTVKMILPIS
jgi:hypothetical protein